MILHKEKLFMPILCSNVIFKILFYDFMNRWSEKYIKFNKIKIIFLCALFKGDVHSDGKQEAFLYSLISSTTKKSEL